MQANAAVVDKCYKNAVKNEVKALNALNKAQAKACKIGVKAAEGKLTSQKYSAQIGKLGAKLKAQFEKIAAKNDKLEAKLSCEAFEDAEFGGSMLSFLRPGGAYGDNQETVPSANNLASFVADVAENCIAGTPPPL